MNGKKIIVCVLMILVSVKIFSQSMTLDEAIRTTATELGQRISGARIPNISSSNQSIEQIAEEIRQQLTAHNTIAVLNFSSGWRELSAYVIVAKNSLSKGLSVELIQEITGLDIEMIQSLQ